MSAAWLVDSTKNFYIACLVILLSKLEPFQDKSLYRGWTTTKELSDINNAQ